MRASWALGLILLWTQAHALPPRLSKSGPSALQALLRSRAGAVKAGAEEEGG